MTEKEEQIFKAVGEVVGNLLHAIAETMVEDRESSLKLIEARELATEVFDKYYKKAKESR